MVKENEINIVIHARGGQGAVTASQIIVESAYLSGKFVDVHAYPSFGAERRGAPIQAYARLSRNEKIWDRSEIEQPDILIVLDESVLTQNIISSLKKGGIFIVNSANNLNFFVDKYRFNENVKKVIVDISKLAIDNDLTIEGAPIVNIPILGLVLKGIPELSLENLKKIIYKRMGAEKGKLNFELLEKGFKLAKMQ